MIQLTELIYFKDCYTSEFTAHVVSADDQTIVLDRTAFYPQGGGQPCDTGTITGETTTARVTKVVKEGSNVVHVLEGPVLTKGEDVHALIDWERRYAHMRYHTAQHLLSAHFLDRHKAVTTGNQIWTDRARIDFDLPSLTTEIIEGAESEINSWVEDSIPVKITMIPREKAIRKLDHARTRIDLLPKTISILRIVTVEGIDSVACAGTHVRNTSEIGRFHVTKTSSKGKGRKRFEFILT